ncbi:MAG: HNH endonuclease [Ignavibacteria bacterium]|nr:HNH endonuclease [Ignavibacteria bacterium]MCU7502523.1 HNH endonuclease [Ignavibacteria bacterium]MCU7515274.1 HNH endonuclease [Ignavibacteria bacterium]
MERNSQGQFKAIPIGVKTPAILWVEKMISCTFEEYYRKHYLEEGWGQKKFAKSIHTSRGLIFRHDPSGKRLCWVERLGLPVRRDTGLALEEPKRKKKKRICAVCGNPKRVTQKAHIIADAEGGPRSYYNIIPLCYDCHTAFHSNDPVVCRKCLEWAITQIVQKATGVSHIKNIHEVTRVLSCIIFRKVL